MTIICASAVVIYYEEALYQVYAPLPYLYRFSSALTSEETVNGIFYQALHSVLLSTPRIDFF